MHRSLFITIAAAATGALAGPVPASAVLCNAAAIARGDCTASAASVPTSTSFNGLCNAAAIARGDCTASAASVPTSTSFNGLCNAAAIARGDCTASAASVPTSTSSFLICNAAAIARGACTTTAASVPTSVASSLAASEVSAVATASPAASATPAAGLTWTVENLSRYCGSDASGCDYNFNLTASDDRPAQACTISRTDVKDAPTESWYNEPCTDAINVSWGYSAQFGVETAFAVMTVANDEEKALAYFGVANVNGQGVTPSNPFGSGKYGNIGPQPVYLF